MSITKKKIYAIKDKALRELRSIGSAFNSNQLEIRNDDSNREKGLVAITHCLTKETEEDEDFKFFSELMTEGNGSARKVSHGEAQIEEYSADPDAYDSYYNQFDGRDIGDEIDEYFESRES